MSGLGGWSWGVGVRGRRGSSSKIIVVVEESVQLLQLGLEAQAESGEKLEQVDRLVAVLEHAIA